MSRVNSWEDDEPYPNASQLFDRAVENACRGKKGQALLKEIEAALLGLPEKKLAAGSVCEDGQVCALGAVAIERAIAAGNTRAEALAWLEAEARKHREEEESYIDGSDAAYEFLKKHLGLKHAIAWRLVWENDEGSRYGSTPEDRWKYMLAWVRERIVRTPEDGKD